MKLGLNVGSGQRPFKTTGDVHWTNIDKVDRIDQQCELICEGSHLPHRDGCVDYFVLSHVYEHFGCGEALGLLAEAHRVLQPGGSLIIAVPDMKALAERWVAGGISEYIFMVNTYGAYMGDEADRHKWGSTPESLRQEIRDHGPWESVTHFDYRTIPGMDLARDWWITALEAVR